MSIVIEFLHEQSLLAILLCGMLSIFLIFLLILVINLYTFHNLSSFQMSKLVDTPLLSILVPARDEEKNIEACVRSLLAQEYAQAEILILDDQSRDATGSILQQIQAELPDEQKGRLRLLAGSTLPAGWVGKNYACHQLAQAARGEYLLFTDADTIHAPTMAHAVLGCMQQYHVQMLTAQPSYIQKSLGERMVIPLINFAMFTLLPVTLIYHRPEPSLAIGNGQLLCFERNAYTKIDGHVSVKGEILEDVKLARICKAAGLRIIFVDAFEQVYCRMYQSFQEVWSGFSKNLFALYNYSLPFALAAFLLNSLLFVFPVLLLCIALFVALPVQVIYLGWADYLAAVVLRMLLALHFTQRERWQALLFCWLHPISMALQNLILLNSIWWRYRKAGTVWKGRYY